MGKITDFLKDAGLVGLGQLLGELGGAGSRKVGDKFLDIHQGPWQVLGEKAIVKVPATAGVAYLAGKTSHEKAVDEIAKGIGGSVITDIVDAAATALEMTLFDGEADNVRTSKLLGGKDVPRGKKGVNA